MSARRRGFTLLEATLALALVGVFMTMALLLVGRSSDDTRDALVVADARLRATRAKRLIETELSGSVVSQLATVATVNTTSYLAVWYRKITGYDFASAGRQLGPLRALVFLPHPGELPGGNSTGQDLDRDGLVDEGGLWLYVDANANGVIDLAGVPGEKLALLVDGVSWQRTGQGFYASDATNESARFYFPHDPTVSVPGAAEDVLVANLDFQAKTVTWVGGKPNVVIVHEPVRVAVTLRNN